MSRVLRITLEYDGADFHGFQRQRSGARTVQGDLEALLSQVLSEPIRTVGAGRTDSGVHAVGQVVSFMTTSTRPVKALQRAINGLMHGDMVARQVEEAPADFDARRSASSRRYQYLVFNDPEPPSVLRRYVWHVFRPLDLPHMQAAARAMLGRHDFRSYSSESSHLQQTRRTVLDCGVNPIGTAGAAVLQRFDTTRTVAFDIEAHAFLPHMVRMMVGTLVRIGCGDWPGDRVRELLERPAVGTAGPPAPPQGLCLVSVSYPPRTPA